MERDEISVFGSIDMVFRSGKRDRSRELNGHTDFLAQGNLVLSCYKSNYSVIVDRYAWAQDSTTVAHGRSKYSKFLSDNVNYRYRLLSAINLKQIKLELYSLKKEAAVIVNED